VSGGRQQASHKKKAILRYSALLFLFSLSLRFIIRFYSWLSIHCQYQIYLARSILLPAILLLAREHHSKLSQLQVARVLNHLKHPIMCYAVYLSVLWLFLLYQVRVSKIRPTVNAQIIVSFPLSHGKSPTYQSNDPLQLERRATSAEDGGISSFSYHVDI